jgi:hypothetical protein
LERRAVLRYNELRMRDVVDVDGDILMDAPAHNSNDQLIGLAGGAAVRRNGRRRGSSGGNGACGG